VTKPCKICGSATEAAFDAVVLWKYDATYSRCPSCGFRAADDPVWLEQAYSSAISDLDLGVVNRAMTSSPLIEGLILSSFDRGARYVDYGAGYGVLVRLMRDRGFDFYWHDLYCENLFAQQFPADPDRRYELLTAFEVFEHLLDPLAQVEAMLDLSDNLLFSTLLVPENVTSDWWYFGTEHGQHIAFYTPPALQLLAGRFGLHVYSDGVQTHLLTRDPISARRFRFFAGQSRAARLATKVLRRRLASPSLLEADFEQVSGHVL
jgi:hypothetical protein